MKLSLVDLLPSLLESKSKRQKEEKGGGGPIGGAVWDHKKG